MSMIAARRFALAAPVPAAWCSAMIATLAVIAGIPGVAGDYWLSAVLTPFLVLSLAGLGLNLLTGYAGQLSLGSAAFMAVGAYATYNLAVRLPGLSLLVDLLLGGLITAAVGAVFGTPSLRIKGFYLIASTLAAQFFIEWLLTKVSWFSHDDTSGVLSAPKLSIAGWDHRHAGRALSVRPGRGRGAVRRGCKPGSQRTGPALDGRARHGHGGPPSSGYRSAGRSCWPSRSVHSSSGSRGALWAFAYLGTVEPHGFDLNLSFDVLFIIIIGGMGSIAGNFYGAAFIVLLPIALSHAAGRAGRDRRGCWTASESPENTLWHPDHCVSHQGTRGSRATGSGRALASQELAARGLIHL